MSQPKPEGLSSRIVLREVFGSALDACGCWIGVVDAAHTLIASNCALTSALSCAGLKGPGHSVPFPCWAKHTGPVTSFACPCPSIEMLPSSEPGFCRSEPSRFPRSIVSQDIRDAGRSTGSRLMVLEPPGQRLSGPSVARRPPNLSPREWELVQGLMSHQRLTTVAAALGISVHTARNHLKAVFRKMNVHSQHELLRLLAESQNQQPELRTENCEVK
jgi:DNA-binding CsgD family transcriptional regulator